MVFTNRFVAFIDILGFKEIVDDHNEIERLFSIVKRETIDAKSPPGAHGIYPSESIKATYFSDSLVLSISTGNNLQDAFKNIRYLLSAIEKIQFNCALENIWMRGGLSCGDLSHDQNVAGRGLVNAYQLERQARFPRILVDNAIIRDIFARRNGCDTRGGFLNDINMTWGASGYSGKFIFNPSTHWQGTSGCFNGPFTDDNLMFVHYLNSVFGEGATIEQRERLLNHLRERMYQSSSVEIYSKYQWVRNYLLSLVPQNWDESESFISLLNLL